MSEQETNLHELLEKFKHTIIAKAKDPKTENTDDSYRSPSYRDWSNNEGHKKTYELTTKEFTAIFTEESSHYASEHSLRYSDGEKLEVTFGEASFSAYHLIKSGGKYYSNSEGWYNAEKNWEVNKGNVPVEMIESFLNLSK